MLGDEHLLEALPGWGQRRRRHSAERQSFGRCPGGGSNDEATAKRREVGRGGEARSARSEACLRPAAAWLRSARAGRCDARSPRGSHARDVARPRRGHAFGATARRRHYERKAERQSGFGARSLVAAPARFARRGRSKGLADPFDESGIARLVRVRLRVALAWAGFLLRARRQSRAAALVLQPLRARRIARAARAASSNAAVSEGFREAARAR